MLLLGYTVGLLVLFFLPPGTDFNALLVYSLWIEDLIYFCVPTWKNNLILDILQKLKFSQKLLFSTA